MKQPRTVGQASRLSTPHARTGETPVRLTHIDQRGKAKMVDVSAKPVQFREAVAHGTIQLKPATIRLIKSNAVAKGDVLNTARLAGIQAAKRTGELIPLCHPLNLTHVDVDLKVRRDRIEITATARIAAQTGVEMESLTAVAVAALTVYDMCKAVDKEMVIGEIKLVRKTKVSA
jgi:cyclic pyranopterin phosphate synthase